mgnify:CR=1 FL=1
MKNKNITPNWFQKTLSNVLQIGQENQFGSTRGLRYGPLRINKTGIFVNNGTLDSTILNSTGFHGYGLTGTEQITFDASTGVNVTDGTNSVFKAEISGTNVGDVTIGAYSGGAGVFYDKSAGTFTIKGALSAGTIDIGGADATSFHVDVNGNMWLGNAAFASAPFSVSNAGTLTIATGDDKIVLNTDTGVGYIDFYSGGALQGRLRSATAGAGGIVNVGGDFAIDNNQSYLAKGTGSDYAKFAVDNSNNTLLESATDKIYLQQHGGSSLATFAVTGVTPYMYIPAGFIQLGETSAPSTPSGNTIVIYLDQADNILKAKDDAGNVHNLW